ncbi:MAG: DUF1302 domain-containing protein [Gammaproteobacteria bacterium]|nr:DUF1302 domain-containing protein [Gammaproteobacteria bacterium]
MKHQTTTNAPGTLRIEEQNMQSKTFVKRSLAASLTLALAASVSTTAQAIEFSSGELSGSFDTTISYGALWRAEDIDPDNVGKAYLSPDVAWPISNAEQRTLPGRWSVNNDDGNRNYPDAGDIVAHTVKFTSELDLRWRNFGAFTRFTGFYDFENSDQDFLPKVADERVGKDIRLLDAYVWGSHELGGKFFDWRVGRQVVSWGESTFIQGGLNIINPVDVSRLRVAGAELKEAFEGVNMLWGSLELTPSLSLEAVYLLEHREIIPDPDGTYFSTNDIGTPGGSYVMLGFGIPDQPVINPDLFDEVCTNGNFAASDQNLPLPLIAAGCGNAVGRSADRFPSDSGQYGAALRWFVEDWNATEFGFYFLNYHSRLPVLSGQAVTTPAPQSATYWTEYPEDINLYGISFNSNVGTWALSGEVTYRPKAPLQADDVELLFGALTPLNPLIPAPVLRFRSQLQGSGENGWFLPGETVQGWVEHKSWQAQTTITKLFGPNNFLGADQIAFVTEVGFNYVDDLPDKDYLRYNGPGTDTGGGLDYVTGDLRNPITEVGGFADDFSWGYRMLARATYNSLIGAWTVSPRIGFNHDVSGTTPGPGGSFVDGRKQLSLGVGFNYIQKWTVDVSYTSYFGGGYYNLLMDRDFFGASVSYSF